MNIRPFLSEVYVRGNGLEIGAFHNPFPYNPFQTTMTYLDKKTTEETQKMAHEDKNLGPRTKVVTVNIVDCGETLGKIQDNFYDFLIASHQLEHCYDPLVAIENHLRVIKKNGLCIYLLPDHKNPIDCNRQISDITHLHFHEDFEEDRIDHYFEYLTVVDHLGEEEAHKVAREKLERNDDIHFHVFDWKLIMNVFLSFHEKAKIEFYYNAGMEHSIVLRKF